MICFRLHRRQISTSKTSLIPFHRFYATGLNNYHNFNAAPTCPNRMVRGRQRIYTYEKCSSWIRLLPCNCTCHAMLAPCLTQFRYPKSNSNYFLIALSYKISSPPSFLSVQPPLHSPRFISEDCHNVTISKMIS